MRLPLHVLAVAFAALCFCLPTARAVSFGATRQEVIDELGKPTATAGRGSREILSYPNGVRITLIDGKVESAQGLTLSVAEHADETAPASETDSEPAAQTAPETKATPEPEPGSPEEEENQQAETPAPPTAQSAKSQPIPPPPAAEKHAEEEESYAEELDSLPFYGIALFLGIHLVATLAGLKIAFKVWTMDALYRGMLAIAGIDVLLHGIFVALGPVTGGFTTMPAVENGIPGVVMIFTIRHFCFNKNLGDAVQTATVVKLAVALLKMFGAMTLLGALAG